MLSLTFALLIGAAARSSIYCALSRAALNAHAGPEGCYFVPSCQPHRPARRALQVLNPCHVPLLLG